LYLSAHAIYEPYRKKIYKKLGLGNGLPVRLWQRFVVFHLVCFSWVFFRAGSVEKGLLVLKNMILDMNSSIAGLGSASGMKNILLMNQSIFEFIAISIGLAVYIFGCVIGKKIYGTVEVFFKNSVTPLRWAVYYLLVFMRFSSTLSG
jgi:hypothetical protein